MFVYLILVCFLHINYIHGLTLHGLNERLGYIEDRINAEDKFRRDDFRTLSTEINLIKEMIQLSFVTKPEGKETNHTSQSNENSTKELEEKIHRLAIGFKEEKLTNVRLRRKIFELQRQVADLNIMTDTSADVLEMFKKDLELMSTHFNLFRAEISEIKIHIQNLTDQNMKQDEQIFYSLQTFMENITEINKHLKAKQHSVGLYKSCKELYNNGVKSNGIYHINTGEDKPLSVYCDMDTDDGGWIVFQRRQDGSVDFDRDWNAYKHVFGDLNGEFWLGNKYLNLLTDDDQHHELRIDLEDFEGNRAYAKYRSFKVQSEDMKYTLEVSGYTGNAGNSLGADLTSFGEHNNMKFSTKDKDNDNSSNNCASNFNGGWWFNNCFTSHLNGLYSKMADCEKKWKCIIWYSWKGSKTSVKFTEMKLR